MTNQKIIYPYLISGRDKWNLPYYIQSQLKASLRFKSTTTNLHHVEGRYLKEVYWGQY